MRIATRWVTTVLLGGLVAGTVAISALAQSTPARDPASAVAATKVRIPTVELRQVALADVFDFFRDAAGMNLFVNWPALEAAGIDRSTPITLRLRRVSMSTVLDLTLRQAAGGRGVLTWYVSDNIVYVTTQELADRQLITRVYPVQDLLVDVPEFRGPTFNLQTGGGGGGGTPPISGNGEDPINEAGTPQERGERLVELIKMLVQPDVWIENGGFSSIRYFNGTLVVTAPRAVHLEIGGR